MSSSRAKGLMLMSVNYVLQTDDGQNRLKHVVIIIRY